MTGQTSGPKATGNTASGRIVDYVLEQITGGQLRAGIVLIPLVSSALLVFNRKTIFGGAAGMPAPGFAICAGGLALYGLALILREHFDRQTFPHQNAPNRLFEPLYDWRGGLCHRKHHRCIWNSGLQTG